MPGTNPISSNRNVSPPAPATSLTRARPPGPRSASDRDSDSDADRDGDADADRFLLGLDPHAPDTHSPLASALIRVGIAPTLIGTRGGHPALRISGRRRLTRLVENVGEPPGDTEAFAHWPRV